MRDAGVISAARRSSWSVVATPFDRSTRLHGIFVDAGRGRGIIGALGVVGRSFSGEDDDRRELHLLDGLARRLVFVAPEEISDVSVDPEGRVPLELDPSPESFDDTSGRHWIWVRPASGA